MESKSKQKIKDLNKHNYLFEISSDLNKSISWLREKKMLSYEYDVVCDSCTSNVKDFSDRSNIDQRRFVCTNNSCRKKFSIRVNSIFYGCKQPLTSLIRIIFQGFVSGTSLVKVAEETSSQEATIRKYYKYCSEIIHSEFEFRKMMYPLGET